jgi:DNA repair exonuclease SbcCD nuclease subunit
LPLTEDELANTGADFVMLGHYHGGVVRGNACYPGSVEPLTWAETGTHAVNVLTVSTTAVEAKLQPINRLFFEEVRLDVTGATSSIDVEERIEVRIRPAESAGLTLRVVLEGEVDRATEVNAAQIAERCRQGFADVIVEDRTVPAYELEQIAEEQTVRGRFVAILLERARSNPNEAAEALAAARAGLRALDGRGDLVDLGAERGGNRVA